MAQASQSQDAGADDLYNGGSDITAFRSAAGLSANPPTVHFGFRASPIPAVSREISRKELDVEWSGAAAKGATINFINGGSEGVLAQALKYAVNNPNLGSVISISYGQCEQPPIGMDVSSFQSLPT